MSENQSSGVVLSDARLTACLQAAWELASLARQLPIIVPPQDDNDHHFAVRGIAARIDQLASILISGLHEDEELVPTKNLNRNLFIPELVL
ncbi:hypothetical protein ACMYR3_10105 [Ampullimonas aquatilis]|uniref:hypothetical protein n=1 Tax=Ampullimonas aquatilis TaxID=1341549 RepID=UPI003C7202D0